MEYEAPTVDVVDAASNFICNYLGPRPDGDGYVFSQGAVCCSIEED